MDKLLGSMYGVGGISGVKHSSKQLWEKLKQKLKTLIRRIIHIQIVVELVFLAKRKKPYCGGVFLNIILVTHQKAGLYFNKIKI